MYMAEKKSSISLMKKYKFKQKDSIFNLSYKD